MPIRLPVRIAFICGILFLAVIHITFRGQYHHFSPSSAPLPIIQTEPAPLPLAGTEDDETAVLAPPLPHITDEVPPIRHRHIAVASSVSFHTEVYDALVWTLERIIQKYPSLGLTVTIYADGSEGEFTSFMQELGMITCPVKKNKDLEDDINRTDLFGDSGEMIDMVITGTCESDLTAHSDFLWNPWQARPADKKFNFACILHDASNTHYTWNLRPWSQHGVFRFFFLSEHVAQTTRATFLDFADQHDDETYSASFYEYLPMDVHVPVVNFSSLIVPKEADPTGGSLSKVAIQGNLEQYRRDYKGIFEDLLVSLAGDPAAWGYLRLSPDEMPSPYKPDPKSQMPPFELHLLGGRGELNIPVQLKDIVKIHFRLDARQYYTTLQSMDLVLPAFAPGNDYFTKLASSTIHTSVQCNVPLLVTNRMRQSYTYLDDSVTIVRPHAVGEIAAIKALRTGIPPAVDTTTHPILAEDVRRMMDQGWWRPTLAFDAFKARLWEKNEELMLRVMRGE